MLISNRIDSLSLVRSFLRLLQQLMIPHSMHRSSAHHIYTQHSQFRISYAEENE